MPGTFVAVLADRTPEAVLGILGVLKTGAAYLPLDPSSPARRVEFVLSDANVVVVCARRALARVHPVRTRTLVELDFDAAWSSRDDTAPPADGCLDDLAYCIYTSGSSGRPRGVLVTHRQIACTTAARTHVYPAPSGGYLMLAPLFFDAACAGLFWVLSVGGKLIIPTDREVEDMRAIARLVRSHGVTHFDGVPSQYAVLLDTHGPALSQLECTILAGEVLPVAVAQLHCQAAPNAALFNEYGATEVSVWTSVFSYPRDFARYRVPVGRAIPNTRMHVLDEELEPVPPGVPAEIYVGGAGVALGYLGRPSLTAERFVPDPFGPPGARMYRMGDIGRLLPDGNTEFLGRLDGQIKVRGFRVEAGEIETALLTHPEIAGAAVVGRADGTSTQLTAYVVWKGSRPHEPSELSVFLRDRLPPYMIPSRFVPLEELPLTRQGKLDRRSLPDPRPSASASRTAPRTSLERDMERIIAEVLGLDSVGIDESFFELGGNSLHLAQIGARLSTTFGIDIPVHQFFTVPTVAGVCAVIELYRREGKESVLGSRRPSDVAAEAVLEAAIVPDGLPAAATDDPSAILLTGGTGYLGAFLLKELLEQTSADVHCLVRAPTRQDGMQRLRRVAKRFRVDLPEELWSRVRPLPGDLGRRCLGLPEETFEELATRIDLILHSGALVNFTYPYSVLMPPNVTGTHEVLRLATTGTLKSVHYISTMDVLIGSHTPRPFLETPLPPEPLRVPFSYPESKWVAEQLVSAAVSRGIPAAIYRPGMMMGHSRTGACHETDYLLVGMRGFLHMGILPEFPEIMNSITVDYASRALVELLKQPSSTGRIFHLWNLDAVPTMTTYDWIRSFGYRFEIVPYDTALERAMGLQLDHPLYPLLPVLFLYRSGQAGTHLTWEDHQTIDHISECENTLNALGNCGLDCPALDERWMHMCLDFLVASGVLEPPDRMGAQHAH
jgi:amino acid adenylation domain-containing protein/thioester reductase-like protein